MKTVVFVLGTGRCGTKSLASVLSIQHDTAFSHELAPVLPWEPACGPEVVSNRLHELHQRDGRVVGDAGFYYLPYVPEIARQAPDTRFVCLKRNRSQVVESYMHHTRGRNHWMPHDGSYWRKDPLYDPCYPKYALPPPPPGLPVWHRKAQAIGLYWDDYYAVAENFACEYAHFTLLETDALNDSHGVGEILVAAGIPEDSRVVVSHTHVNRGRYARS